MGEKRARRRFSRQFKLEAVRQVVGEGRTQKAVTEELGIPTRWMCSALAVSDRGFRSWRSRGESRR